MMMMMTQKGYLNVTTTSFSKQSSKQTETADKGRWRTAGYC
jgi:hypothetical protein